MPKRAKQPEPEPGLVQLFQGALLASGAAISRNPVIVGGSTAFMVALFYVSANAIWYQPGMHEGALFATRPQSIDHRAVAPESGTTILIEREQREPARIVLADPVVERVQDMLSRLNLYEGAVDGIAGPQTLASVRKFQELAGLEQTGQINDLLIAALERRSSLQPPDAAPVPARRAEASDSNPTTASIGDERVRRVQAGLRAFGNDGIVIDGVSGPATKAAIREFQSLFGLTETGEIDDRLLAKMRETGLTN